MSLFQTNWCVGDEQGINKITDIIKNNSVSPAEDYFNGEVLGLTKNSYGDRYSWNDYGHIQPHLVGCLALSWCLVGVTLIFGVKVYGKFAYFITLSPYFVLTFLLGKCLQLNCSTDIIVNRQ